MRIILSRRRAALSALATVALAAFGIALPKSAHAITPLLSASVGTGANTSYFVLDFQDQGSSYAFAYHYDGAKTGGDLIDALAGANIGFSDTYTDFGGTLGRFFDGFSYNGDSANRDVPGFDQYFNYFNSTDGTAWDYANFGPDSTPLVNQTYTGYSWASDPNVSNPPPVTPFAVTVPEANAGVLVAVGGAGLLGLAMIRRRRTA